MKSDLKFFRRTKVLPADIFFNNVLYHPKFGYYSSTQPFGGDGDFITSPKISNLFSEMIGIWIIALSIFVFAIWIPNMIRKDKSLSRYPEFDKYKRNSSKFIPFLW